MASGAATALTSLPIASRCLAVRPWKVPVSNTSRKPEPMPASRSAVTSPCTSQISTPASSTRSRARRSAFSTISTPGHLPAALREPNAPDRTAAAEVERRTVGRPVPVLLARDQLEQLAGEGRVLGEVLPGMEAERVGERVVHERPPATASPVSLISNSIPLASRFLNTTGIVSLRISVGLNSTISVPA